MSDAFQLSFHGPARRNEFFSTERRRTNYLSLVHWIEAAKFDSTVHAEERAATVLMPGVKEVTKYAASHRTLWRSDWPLVVADVVQQGLAFMHHEHPGHTMWDDHLMLVDVLAQTGISRAAGDAIVRRFHQLAKSPRILVLGAAAAPPEELNRRFRLLEKKLAGSWQLVHWMGRHGCWSLHDRMDAYRLPIMYRGHEGARLTPACLDELLPHVDQCLVFQARGGKHMDKIIQSAKRHSTPCEVALWSPDVVRSMDLFTD